MNSLIYLTYNSSNQVISNFINLLSVDNKLSITCIDNASSDNTVELLEKIGANVHKNEVNVGYTKAINQGIEIALEKNPEWIFLINPDVRVPEHWDSILTPTELTCRKKCGLITARTVDPNGNITYAGGMISSYPQLLYWPTSHELLGTQYSVVQSDAICTTQFRHRLKDTDVTEEVDWASFCVVALRAEMVREIGMLDEKYFLYCSDSEYCILAKQHGWEIWYVPATFMHEGSSNVKQAGSRIQELAITDFRRFAK